MDEKIVITFLWSTMMRRGAKSVQVFRDKTRILVTGGGSQNVAILQVISDIFNAPVYTQVNPAVTNLINNLRS